MDILQLLLKKWVVPKFNIDNSSNDQELKYNLSLIYTCLKNMNFTTIKNAFMERVEDLEYDFTPDALTSGAICFFGSMLMSLAQLGYIKNIEELFTLASLYMILDHYIDDINISDLEKAKTISEIKKVIKNPDLDINIIEKGIIRQISKRYISLITKIPSAEPHLKALFKSEVDSMYLQKDNNLDISEYYRINEEKGGLTCCAIQSILELEVTEEEYKLGACIQLVDNVLDLDDDIHDNINTEVTHYIANFASLNHIFTYNLYKIYNLSNKYNLMKPVLIMGLLFSMDLHKEYVTPKLLELLEPFMWLKNISKDEIRDIIWLFLVD